ncbi:hypothetical protein VP01_5027g1 [Puccinia sorghi]|uniref:Uncharacterized protein n=1 Tax=Puccinia sorghi TaxID=27349 RepID=A0A0L6UNL7_9BASI|nr:hypothetical protein VP01_5027g1 [Puccinia sorghi]
MSVLLFRRLLMIKYKIQREAKLWVNKCLVIIGLNRQVKIKVSWNSGQGRFTGTVKNKLVQLRIEKKICWNSSDNMSIKDWKIVILTKFHVLCHMTHIIICAKLLNFSLYQNHNKVKSYHLMVFLLHIINCCISLYNHSSPCHTPTKNHTVPNPLNSIGKFNPSSWKVPYSFFRRNHQAKNKAKMYTLPSYVQRGPFVPSKAMCAHCLHFGPFIRNFIIMTYNPFYFPESTAAMKIILCSPSVLLFIKTFTLRIYPNFDSWDTMLVLLDRFIPVPSLNLFSLSITILNTSMCVFLLLTFVSSLGTVIYFVLSYFILSNLPSETTLHSITCRNGPDFWGAEAQEMDYYCSCLPHPMEELCKPNPLMIGQLGQEIGTKKAFVPFLERLSGKRMKEPICAMSFYGWFGTSISVSNGKVKVISYSKNC